MPTGKITPISNLVGKIDKGAGTNDHNKLINRDLADQHPMEAIIGLLDALNQIDSKILTLDEKIDSGADFVASELNKLRTELNNYKEFVNLEFINTNNKIDATKEELEAEIINLQDQITIIENHLNEVEARFTEQIETLNTNLESAKQELNTRIDEEAEKAKTALDGEVGRAITKENEIIEALEEEATARAEADTLLQESLTNEIERATGAEVTLETNLNAETQARTEADAALQEALNQEIANRVADVDAEEARATEAEADLKDYTDAEITKLDKKIKEDLEPRLTELSEAIENETEARQTADTALQEQIDNISIEELSKRTTYRTLLPENPSKNDKFVLVEEYTEGLNYYKQTYDVDTTKLNGMWQVDETKLRAFTWDELNELMDGEASFWWNVNCYWYNNNTKKSFSRFGLIIPSGTFVTWALGQDLYGFGLTNKFYSGNSEYSAIGNLHDTDRGVIALPVRHTRDYDFQSELGYKDVDYNPLGEPGLYPSNFKTLYFDITKETSTTKAIAKLMSTIAIKISDENLELGNTNYKMKFVPATVTAETFEPDTYYYYDENFEQEFIKTNVIKSSGYYPAYKFNSENTYYKQVYDVDDTKLYGMWELPLAPNYIGDWPDWAFGWINETRGYFYHDDGTREDFYRTGALMPAYRETNNQCWGFAIGDGWNGQYGIQEQGRYIYPDKSGADMGAGWAFGLNDWDQPDAKRILYYTETNTTFANGFKATGAIKVSDALLPFGDYNYKTKYVQVEVDENTFEPGKYYTYFNKEADEQNEVNFIINTKNYVENTPYYEVTYIDKISNEPVYQKVTLTESDFYSGLQNHNYYRLVTLTAQPEEYTVTRIQLDSDKSIYRDVLGNNLVEITDDNVIVGGENLIPNLTINKDKITSVVLENNAETVFEKPIENLIIEIPNNLKHGFCSFLSFETAKTDVSVGFNTVYANKPLKFIFSGATVKEEDLDFATETQYNLMFLCNGIYLEVYIQEIQLI